MDVSSHKLSLLEKIGYASGDAAANLVWRGALAYLAVFYTDTFGLSAESAALLILLVRLSDGITDIIMGMIADRTNTRWGKFRPYILWSAPVLGASMVLCFTTPDLGPTGKLIWAYVTYIALTLAYTVNNVPYSALMGVMTPDHEERSVLSGFRFAGAFAGGALVMGFLPDLVKYFGNGNDQIGYQYTMYFFAVLLVIMCVFTYFTTKERVTPTLNSSTSLKDDLMDLTKNLPGMLVPLTVITLFFYYRNLWSGVVFVIGILATYWAVKRLIQKPESQRSHTQQDLVDLLTNLPWAILLATGFLFMMFNGIRYGVIAYYFKHYVGDESLAGTYFIALLLVSIFAALTAGYLTKILGKKNLFIACMVLGGVTTTGLYFMESQQVTLIFVIGCVSEFFAAIMPVLFFSMLGDAADYSEWKHGRRATGLVFSAGTFINKTGGGFAGALVLIVLGAYGYVGTDHSTISQAIPGMISLMSWIPMLFALGAAVVLLWYPLTTEKMAQIQMDLMERRNQASD
jgi:glycoside/pentoside/hexuronide:cation symporter, GPH family